MSNDTHRQGDRPVDYIIKLRGQTGGYSSYQERLEIRYRLLWLRQEHPEARIYSECVHHNNGFALFKVRIDLGEKGYAEGHGAESRETANNYIERAETWALGSALDALGYSTEAAFLAAGQRPPLEEPRPSRLERPPRPAGPPPEREPRLERPTAFPPSEPDIQPEYDAFWREAIALGYDRRSVLSTLGIPNLRGTDLKGALEKLKAVKAAQSRVQPAASSA